MATTDPRVDVYIESAAPFARPVLEALRRALHAGCPEVAETIKWGMPFFSIDGRILAHMAAFKRHCGFGFWHGRKLADLGKSDEAMGQFGRIVSVADLPPRRELSRLIRLAVASPAQGAAKGVASKRLRKPPLPTPEALAAALSRNAGAEAHFAKLSDSHRREYAEWIVAAKRDETRTRRVAEAVEWLAEGKTRNWKYEAC